jgi:hypothetical protein
MVKELLSSSISDFPPPTHHPLLSALIRDNISGNFGLRLTAWLAMLQTAMEHKNDSTKVSERNIQ